MTYEIQLKKLNKKKIFCASLGTKIDPRCIESNDYACYLRAFYAGLAIITSISIITFGIHNW